MKKILLSVLLSFLLVFTLSVSAAEKPMHELTFESSSLSGVSGLSFSGNTNGEYIFIDEDLTNANNHVLKFNGDGADSRYCAFKEVDIYGQSELSFKIYAESGFTNYRVYLRDDGSDTLVLMNMTPQAVNYLSSVTQTGDLKEKWISFKFVMDFKNDYITCYSDITTGFNGSLEADYSGKISALIPTAYAAHNSHSTALRFGPMETSGTVYVDDLKFIYDYSNAPTVSAGEKFLYDYDFENFTSSSEIPGIAFSKNPKELYMSITQYPAGSNNNVLKFYGDGEVDPDKSTSEKTVRYDRYMNFNEDLSGKSELSFKVYAESDLVDYSVSFRDVSTYAPYLVSLKPNAVTYLGSTNIAANLSGTFTEKWITFKFLIDTKNKSITCYSDISTGFNGVLVEDYTGYMSIDVSANTHVRFGHRTNTGTAYIDDLKFNHNYSITNNFITSNQRMYKKYSDRMYGLSYLREGEITFSSDVTAAGASKSLMLIAAQYTKDEYDESTNKLIKSGRMKLVSSSPSTLVSNGDTKTLSTTMNIKDLDKDDYVKLFLLDASGNISPLSQVFSFKTFSTYDRPSPIEIKTDFYAQNTNETHPRVIATKSDFDRMRNYAKTDETFIGWLESVKETADALCTTTKLPTTKEEAAAKDDQKHILDESRDTMNAVLPMAIMYQMADDAEKAAYAEGIWRFMEIVCDQTKFPDWNHDVHYLDTAEMGFAVAIAYDWCYDHWTEDRLKTMQTALYNNMIIPSYNYFIGNATYNPGLRNKSNWCPVTNAGTITASVALFDLCPELCSYVISSCCEALENCLGDYAIDGGYSESSSYWEYGTRYLMWCLSSLDAAFGQSYGIEDADGLSNTGFFPYYATGPVGAWGYHDGSTSPISTSLSLFFAKKYNNSDLEGLRLHVLKNGYYGKEVEPSYIDMLFYNDKLISSDFSVDDLDLDFHYQHVQTVFMRGSFTNENTTFVGFHGGINNVNHGDLDAGNFAIDMQGVRFLDELGSDNYALDGYSDVTYGDRWQYLRKNAEGQNTIAIVDDSKELKYGQVPSADVKIIDFESSNNFSYAIADMTPAYGSKVDAAGENESSNAKRGLMLLDNRNEVVVQDEITFNTPTELYWIACIKTQYNGSDGGADEETRATIDLSQDQRSAIIEIEGKRMYVKLNSDNPDLKFEIKNATDPLLPGTVKDGYSRKRFTRLVIHAKNVEKFNVSVSFKLIEDPTADSAEITYNKTSLDNWNSYN